MKPKLIYQTLVTQRGLSAVWEDCHKQKYSREEPHMRRIVTKHLDGKLIEVDRTGKIINLV